MDDIPKTPKTGWTQFLARVFGISPAGPQRELYEKALLLKAENQQAFMPQGRGARHADVLIGSSLFVKHNPRFAHNPCYVERGVDWATYKALLRRPSADVESFFARMREEFAQRHEKLLPLWTRPGRGTLQWWAAFGARFRAQQSQTAEGK